MMIPSVDVTIQGLTLPPVAVQDLTHFPAQNMQRPPQDMEEANQGGAPALPSTFFSLPLQSLAGYDASYDDAGVPDGVGSLRLLSYPSLVMLNRSESRDNVLCSITEGGLIDLDTEISSQTLEIRLCGIAHRANTMAIVTVYNQGYIFDLAPHLGAGVYQKVVKKPLRLELNIRQNAVTSACHVADIIIKAEIMKKVKGRMEMQLKDFTGTHTLHLFGDSDGKVNFVVADANVAIHTDSFTAHNSKIGVSLPVLSLYPSLTMTVMMSILTSPSSLLPTAFYSFIYSSLSIFIFHLLPSFLISLRPM